MNEATEKVLQVLRRPKSDLTPKEMAQDLANESWQRKQGDAKRQWAVRGEDGKKIKDSPKDKKRSLIGEGSVTENVQRRTSQAIYDRLGLKSKNIDFEAFHRGLNKEKKDKLKTKGDKDKAAHAAEIRLSERPDSYPEKEKLDESNVAQRVRLDKEKHPNHYCQDKKCLWKTTKGGFEGRPKEYVPCRNHPHLVDKNKAAHDLVEEVITEKKKPGIMDRIRNALDTSQEGFLRRYHESPEYKAKKAERAKMHGRKKVQEEVDILQLDEKIHPGADWHKNDPDELMDHIYWLHGKKSPKDLHVRAKAYQGLVRQLHASNPAPHKKALDRHMNHHVNQAKKKLLGKKINEALDESVVSAAHAHREPVSQSLKWEMQKRKDKKREQMSSVMADAKKEYAAATAPKPKSKAKLLAVSDMKKKPVQEARDADERAGDREDRKLKRDAKEYAKSGKKPKGLKDLWDFQHPKKED